MKHILALVITVNFLLADTFLIPEEAINKIELKPNQVLLIDYRTQKPIGIIEITESGRILRLPLPSRKKASLTQKKPNNLKELLINKNKQWNKKQIPYLIEEETIPSDSTD